MQYKYKIKLFELHPSSLQRIKIIHYRYYQLFIIDSPLIVRDAASIAYES